MINNSITVLVTGVGGGGVGEQIIKALRLAEMPYRIIGTDVSPISKGLMEVDHPYVVPLASAPDFVPSLLEICARHKVRALFCGSEPELREISERREEFDQAGIFLPMNPREVVRDCLDKFATARILMQLGLPCPRSVKVCNESELEQVDFIPAILKPLSGGGSANVHVVQNRNELHLLGRYLLDYHPCIVVQEYVGQPDSEYTVGVLLSMQGELINSIAIRRSILSGLGNRLRLPNRTGDTRFGAHLVVSSGISQGHLDRYPEVTRPCEEIALALGCQSAVNIQCRFVDGRPYVFEINPRYSGTTSLRALAGYNEPDIMIRKHLLHESIPSNFAYRSGNILRGLQEKFVVTDGITAADEGMK